MENRLSLIAIHTFLIYFIFLKKEFDFFTPDKQKTETYLNLFFKDVIKRPNVKICVSFVYVLGELNITV